MILNDYSKKYYEIIEEAQALNRVKGNEYLESHHIIPKSLGGSNKKSNLVLLTPEEHYICHSLLPDFCEGKDRRNMLFAWHLMKNWLVKNSITLIGPKKYGELKRAYSAENSGINHPCIKPIYQLDSNTGEIIKKWNYVKQAIDEFLKNKDIKSCSFAACARSTEAVVSHNFCWAYPETLEKTRKNIILKKERENNGYNTNSKSVYQLNKDTGEIIKKWETLSQATQFFNGVFGIASCARNIQRSAGGYCWAYEKTLEKIQAQIKDKVHFLAQDGINSPTARSIYQLDKDTGEIIKLWDYVLLASKNLNINKGNMANCANKGFGKIVGGYCWAYEETLKETLENIKEKHSYILATI